MAVEDASQVKMNGFSQFGNARMGEEVKWLFILSKDF